MADISHNVPTEGYGQHTASLCWFACYRMLYAWKHLDENTIGPKLEGAGLNLKELRMRGLYGDEFPKAAGALGLSGWRGGFIKESDEGTLLHLLSGYGPLFCAIVWEGGGGHAVLIRGYDSKLKQFLIVNPFNASAAGTVDNDFWTMDHIKRIIYDGRFAIQAWP